MNTATDTTLYYLVVDIRGARVIHVFLGRDPAADGPGGPLAEPVSLHLLPGPLRFGRPGELLTGRAVLGQNLNAAHEFREFRSEREREQAAFRPIAHYRVCDAWNDYQFPWPSTLIDLPTQDTETEEPT